MDRAYFTIVQSPKSKYELEFSEPGLKFQMFQTQPNRFWRLMQYLVFGFKWRRVNENEV